MPRGRLVGLCQTPDAVGSDVTLGERLSGYGHVLERTSGANPPGGSLMSVADALGHVQAVER